MEQEHKNKKREILQFAVNCSDYVSMQDAFSLPYEYRKIVYELAEKRVNEFKKSIQENSRH